MTQIKDDEIKYKFDNISMSFISVIGDKIITKQRVFSPLDGDVNRKNHLCLDDAMFCLHNITTSKQWLTKGNIRPFLTTGCGSSLMNL